MTTRRPTTTRSARADRAVHRLVKRLPPLPRTYSLALVGLLVLGTLIRARLGGTIRADGSLSLDPGSLLLAVGLVKIYLGARWFGPLVLRWATARPAPPIAVGAGLALLILPLTPLGLSVGGARVGVLVPVVGRVQLIGPATVLVTIGLAVLASRFPDDRNDGLDRFVPYAVIATATVVLMVLARDLGTAMVLLVVIGLLAATVGRQSGPLVAFGLFGGVAGGAAALGTALPARRLAEWLAGGSEQVRAGLALIADGGWTGHGLGRGHIAFVPLAAEDMTIAALAADTGLLGVLLLISLWCGVLGFATRQWRHLQGTRAAILTALVTVLVAQIAVALLMSANLLPLSGLPLPGISSGASHLLTTSATLGLLTAALTSAQPADDAPRTLSPTVPIAALIAASVATVATLASLEPTASPESLGNRLWSIQRQAAVDILDRDGEVLAETRWRADGTPVRWITDDPAWFNLVGPADHRVRPRGVHTVAELRCRRAGWRNWTSWTDPCSGSVTLTVDPALQRELHHHNQAVPGDATVVVVDLEGRVLAASSSHDPNGMEELTADDDPAAFHLLGPPGSTVKPALAALLTEEAPTFEPPVMRSATTSDGGVIRSWQYEGCGGPATVALLVASCNPAALAGVQAVGHERWSQMLDALYAHDRSSSGLPVGRARLPSATDDGHLELAAIGQGDLQVTVAHQAALAAALADGELRPSLTVLADAKLRSSLPTLADPAIEAKGRFAGAAIDAVRRGMGACVAEGACGRGLAALEVPVAAKTGTAQRDGGPDLGWCLAYWPTDNPQRAAAVRLDHPDENRNGAQACDHLASMVDP